jgi:hypothetical protein
VCAALSGDTFLTRPARVFGANDKEANSLPPDGDRGYREPFVFPKQVQQAAEKVLLLC